MATDTNNEKAIKAIIKATGQSREEVLKANPLLAEEAQPASSGAASRAARGAGSTASYNSPFRLPM